MISPTTIERVKETPIYEVVRHYVELKKAGHSAYSALSPFTDEKTPSFYVVPKKNIFKCFSTGKGGDGIAFVMEHCKLDFVEAIKEICGKIGEPIEYEISEKANEEQEEKESLFKLTQAAARRFAQALFAERDNASNPATAEILKRKFTPDTIAQWQIGYAPTHPFTDKPGYAPEHWRFLTEILHEKGMIAPALKLGIVQEKDKVVYDSFRNRLMFPVHNNHGRICGFSGRWLGEKDKFNAKYINSSESMLFDKKRILFGLHFASAAIRENGWAGLVEGNADVISFHQAGQENTVGTGGTVLTPEQCALLKKYCNKVVLFPDPDQPGEESAMRSIDILMKEGFETAVVPMPQPEDGRKIDPDELVRLFDELKLEAEKPKVEKKKPVKKTKPKKK